MRLKDIMSTKVEVAQRDTTVAAAREALRRRNIHHLVIVDGKEVVGVVSGHDLSSAQASEVTIVGELVSEAPWVGTPETTIREAANRLRANAISCLPVVEEGKLVGIVTVTDILELNGRGDAGREDRGAERNRTVRQHGPTAMAGRARMPGKR